MQPKSVASIWDQISRETRTKLDLYDILLSKWQASINLVGRSTLPEAETRHFADSLQLLDYIPKDAKALYDLGTGAGFPGLVLAIARPDLKVHLIESDQRKCAFLQTVARETGVDVAIHTARVENLTLPSPDVVTARALADLRQLLDWTAPWWEAWPECRLIFPKGATVDDELIEARDYYSFELEIKPSKTDPKARILLLGQVQHKAK